MLVWHCLPAQELKMFKAINRNKRVEHVCVAGKGL